MSTYNKTLLSGCTNGKAVKITTTATPGDLIHTAVSGATDRDEIWLYLMNNDTNRRFVTIQWGETGTDGNIIVYIDAQSNLILAIPGFLLQNSLVVRAFADAANKVMVHGFVNRITG